MCNNTFYNYNHQKSYKYRNNEFIKYNFPQMISVKHNPGLWLVKPINKILGKLFKKKKKSIILAPILSFGKRTFFFLFKW